MSNIDAGAKTLEELALEKNLTMRDIAKKAWSFASRSRRNDGCSFLRCRERCRRPALDAHSTMRLLECVFQQRKLMISSIRSALIKKMGICEPGKKGIHGAH